MIKESTREFVFKRDGYECVTCGARTRLTIDHVIPKSRGGRNSRSNLQTLCFDCNQAKADSNPEAEVVAQIKIRTRKMKRQSKSSGQFATQPSPLEFSPFHHIPFDRVTADDFRETAG